LKLERQRMHTTSARSSARSKFVLHRAGSNSHPSTAKKRRIARLPHHELRHRAARQKARQTVLPRRHRLHGHEHRPPARCAGKICLQGQHDHLLLERPRLAHRRETPLAEICAVGGRHALAAHLGRARHDEARDRVRAHRGFHDHLIRHSAISPASPCRSMSRERASARSSTIQRPSGARRVPRRIASRTTPRAPRTGGSSAMRMVTRNFTTRRPIRTSERTS